MQALKRTDDGFFVTLDDFKEALDISKEGNYTFLLHKDGRAPMVVKVIRVLYSTSKRSMFSERCQSG